MHTASIPFRIEYSHWNSGAARKRDSIAMMSLNNEVFTLFIFHLCATSLVAATNAPTTPSGTDKMIHSPLLSAATSATTAATESLKINNNYADERNVTMESSLTPTMATPKGDLHLDEYNFVATTPKIQTTKAPSRYEMGLEDYEEAVARVDKMKEDQQRKQSFNGLEAIVSLFDTANTVWSKVSAEANASQNRAHYNGANAMTTRQPLIVASNQTEVAEGRYIQGDPLKGYYDFIITEGSYKFWAIFQLFTAGLMIYSTFAAIYYSKVNPVVGDYDYTAYLGGARSMADDPEPMASNPSPLSELANSYLFQTASHGFQFVLDAIEKNYHHT